MFTKTKSHVAKAIGGLAIGIIFAFILSLMVGMQDTTHYNVMGITMPWWFYPLCALDSLPFIYGGFHALLTVVSAWVESRVHADREYNGAEVEPQRVQFEVSDLADEDIYDSSIEPDVYDPQKALQR
jgi:hypothetical protein